MTGNCTWLPDGASSCLRSATLISWIIAWILSRRNDLRLLLLVWFP